MIFILTRGRPPDVAGTALTDLSNWLIFLALIRELCLLHVF